MGLEQIRQPNADHLEELAKSSGPRTNSKALPCKNCKSPILWHFTGTRWQPLNPNNHPHFCQFPRPSRKRIIAKYRPNH